MFLKFIARIQLFLTAVTIFKDWPVWLLHKFGLWHKRGVGLFRLRSGRSFTIDYSHTSINTFQEVYLANYYQRYYRIRPGDVVIDIGASFGSFAVLAASKGATVHAYEPMPDAFEFLRQNVKGLSIIPHQMAVSDTKGKILMHRALINHESSSAIHNSTVAYSGSISLLSVTLADVLKDIERCDLLKMDCEGSEVAILRATTKADLGRISNIALEYHANRDEVCSILIEKGFRIMKRNSGICGYIYARQS